MPTISSEQVIRNMLDNNGVYWIPGELLRDPQARAIHSYVHTITGETLYHVCYGREEYNWVSEYVTAPVLLWHQAVGLTEEGKKCLSKLSS